MMNEIQSRYELRLVCGLSKDMDCVGANCLDAMDTGPREYCQHLAVMKKRMVK